MHSIGKADLDFRPEGQGTERDGKKSPHLVFHWATKKLRRNLFQIEPILRQSPVAHKHTREIELLSDGSHQSVPLLGPLVGDPIIYLASKQGITRSAEAVTIPFVSAIDFAGVYFRSANVTLTAGFATVITDKFGISAVFQPSYWTQRECLPQSPPIILLLPTLIMDKS